MGRRGIRTFEEFRDAVEQSASALFVDIDIDAET